jgi:hypothetical protein
MTSRVSASRWRAISRVRRGPTKRSTGRWYLIMPLIRLTQYRLPCR